MKSENTSTVTETQTINSESVNESMITEADVESTVVTKHGYFEMDLFGDLVIMNIPTLLCLGDICLRRRKKGK